jgi:phosphohistidine phosphatase SixA
MKIAGPAERSQFSFLLLRVTATRRSHGKPQATLRLRAQFLAALLSIFLLPGALPDAFCAEPGNMFTIFLVRHAEKSTEADQPDDPALSTCGQLRAGALADQLQFVNLDHVYSTPYERTRKTADPVAAGHQLPIEIYDPQRLEEFTSQLLERGENTLVVGHSNTTAVLAGMLAGEAGEEFSEDEYDRLYLVTVSGGQRQVHLLSQAFHCNSPP